MNGGIGTGEGGSKTRSIRVYVAQVIGPHCSSLFFLTHCNQGYTLVLDPWQPRNVQVQSKGNKNENLEKKKLRQT